MLAPRYGQLFARFPLAPRSRAFVGRLNPLSRPVRDGGGLPDVLGVSGTLEVRLARTTKDIRRAQKLRYKVFFEEMGATPSARARLSRRDIDAYDRLCDHLLVIDRVGKVNRFGRPKPKVVGTYRLLRSDVARAAGADFYTAGEFDLTNLLAANPAARLLELGRSCVLKPYRSKRVLDLLWQGLWHYIAHHRIELMFGCASFEGTIPAAHALPLSFLHHFAATPEGESARAHPWNHTTMDLMPVEAVDPKAALRALPPLIKGYLKVGARFGAGAVVDRPFGTTDVFVSIRVKDIDPRYLSHYAG
jgi:putative hemolysin